MRKIRFRAKRQDNGEWIHSGTLVTFNNGDTTAYFLPKSPSRCEVCADLDGNLTVITRRCESMMTPRDKVLTATARAQGAILTMGALLRDMGIANMVDEGKTGELCAVVSGTVNALNEVARLWDDETEGEDNA